MASKTSTTPTVVSATFPSGEAVYTARYVGIKPVGETTERTLKWSEMRAHFKVTARSSRFLQEAVAYVNASEELKKLHPDMVVIEGANAPDASDQAREMRAAIREARKQGQGFSILQARTGLKPATLRKIVGEEVGSTARQAYGQRYHQKVAKVETTEEAVTGESKPATADLAAALEASVTAVKAARKPRATRKPRAKKAAK